MRTPSSMVAAVLCWSVVACSSDGPRTFEAQPVGDFVLERIGGVVNLTWSNPRARGFESVLVLRYGGNVSADDVPQPDVTYRVNDSIGAGVVVYVGEETAYSDAPPACDFYVYQVWAQFRDGGWSDQVQGDVELTEANAVPSNPVAVNGPNDACDPTNTFLFSTDPVPGASQYNWSVPEGSEVLDGQGTPEVTIRLNSSGEVRVTAANGCSSSTATPLMVNLASPPLVNRASVISGPTMECPGANNVSFSVDPIPNATSYRWTLPPGATIVGGDGTEAIEVNLGSEGGMIAVVGENPCGQSAELSRPLGITSSSPAVPTTITGPSIACGGAAQSYAVEAADDASSYTWIVPPGASVIEGQGTNAVRVAFGGSGGAVLVQANNGCGTSTPNSIDVTVEPGVPSAPGPITGTTSACQQTPGLLYEIDEVPDAESYTWTLPPGATFMGTDNSTSVTVNLGDAGGAVSVTANNTCGSSSPSQLTIAVAGALPPVPSAVTGPDAACASTTETFSVAPQIAPLSWSVPADATILSGQGTNSIDVQFGSMAGAVSVVSTAPCGPSVPSALPVSVNSMAPTLPSPVEGPAAVCIDRVGNLFSVPDATDAASYQWTLPAGATIIEGETGLDTSSITVDWADQFGNVDVQATNGCGSSGIQTLSVQQWSTAAPAASTQPLSDRVQTNYTFEVAPIVGVELFEKQLSTAMGAWASLGQDDDPVATAFVSAPGQYRFRTRGKLSGCSDTLFVTSDAFMALGPWSIRRAQRPNNRLRGLSAGATSLVAVGELRDGTPGLLRSADALAWTTANVAPAQSFQGVASSPSEQLAVGLGGVVARSTDGGATWSSETVGVATDLWSAARIGSAWVAVGLGGSVFTDAGSGWEAEASGTLNDLHSVAPTGAGVIAVGAGGALRVSTDAGQSWGPSGANGSGATLYGVTEGTGITVAVGDGGTVIWTGAPFTSATPWMLSTAGTETLRAVSYSPDVARFVAVGTGGSIQTSVDGDQWSSSTAPTGVDLFAVIYDAGLQIFVAGGDDGTIITSADGLSWSKAQDGSVLREVGVLSSAAIIVGDDGTILRSTDGTSWEQQESPTTVDLYSVSGDGAGNAVAVGAAGTVLRSGDDGATWAVVVSGGADLRRVRFGDGRWVAVGDGGIALTSTAPSTAWSPSTTNTNVDLQGLDFGAGLFTATGFGGSGGAVGVHWNGLSAAWSNSTGIAGTGQLRSVVFDGTEFYAAGDDTGGGNNVYASGDGMSWIGQTVAAGASLRDVRDINAMLVAIGDSVVHSTDASTWLTQGPIAGNPILRAGALFSGRMIAVGDRGAVVSSP